MISVGEQHLDTVFAALAHPVRRRILEQCGTGPQSVGALAAPHRVSLNAVSKHIRKLETAELISRRPDGNLHLMTLNPEAAKPAMDWLKYHVELWDSSLLALKASLEEEV